MSVKKRLLFLICLLMVVALVSISLTGPAARVVAQDSTAEVTDAPPDATDAPTDTPTETVTPAPGPVHSTSVDPVFGCNMLWGYSGPAPWLADESGTPIVGAWVIPNNDGISWRVTAKIIVNPGVSVNLMLTNGKDFVRFHASKPPAFCVIDSWS